MRFRQGDGVLETVYRGFLVALTFFSIYGFRSGFEPGPEWAYLSGRYCWILGAIVLIPVVYTKSPKNRPVQDPMILLAAWPVVYGTMVLFSYAVMSQSSPAVHATFFGSHFEAPAEVLDTRRSRGRYGGCKYEIIAKDTSLQGFDYQLCVKPRLWKNVSVGAILLVSGKETSFGRLVTSTLVQS